MHCSLVLEMSTLNRVDDKLSGVQILLLWKTIALKFNRKVMESLLNYFLCQHIVWWSYSKHCHFLWIHMYTSYQNICKKYVQHLFNLHIKTSFLRKEIISLVLLKFQWAQCISIRRQNKKTYWGLEGRTKYTHCLHCIATFLPLVHIFVPIWKRLAKL